MKKRIIISVSIVMAIMLITAGLSFCLVACDNNSSNYDSDTEQNNISVDNRTPKEKFQQDFDGKVCSHSLIRFAYSKSTDEVKYTHTENVSGLSLSIEGKFTPNKINSNNNGTVTLKGLGNTWTYSCSYFISNRIVYFSLNKDIKNSDSFTIFQIAYDETNIENSIKQNMKDGLTKYKDEIFSQTGYDIFEE